MSKKKKTKKMQEDILYVYSFFLEPICLPAVMGRRKKYRCGVETNVAASWQNILVGAILRIVASGLGILGFALKIWERAIAQDSTWWSILFIGLLASVVLLVSSIFILIGILQDPKL